MIVKQLSVFIENREGRLEEVTKTLADNEINIISLSLADTSEYGMLRLIVSNPELGKKVLKESGFSAMLTDVICVKVSHKIGALYQLLNVLSKALISVEYMYAFTFSNDASMVMKLSDPNRAIEVLKENNLEVIKAEEVYCINMED